MVIAVKKTESAELLEKIIELQSTVNDTIRHPYNPERHGEIKIRGKELFLKTPSLSTQIFARNPEPWKVHVYSLFREDVLHTIIHPPDNDRPHTIEKASQYSPKDFIKLILTNPSDVKQVRENVSWLLDKCYNRNLI